VPTRKAQYAPRAKVSVAQLLKYGRALLTTLANATDATLDALHSRSRDYLLRQCNVVQLRTYRDELRMIWPGKHVELEPGSGVFGPVVEISALAEPMFEASGPGMSLEQWVCECWLSARNSVRVEWGRDKRLYPSPESLAAQLAWAFIHNAEHLGYCANPNCKRPRFIKRKADRKYCCSACAKPAKREAKRRWWSENRAKKNSKKSRNKSSK
jgi:hypothetical protein